MKKTIGFAAMIASCLIGGNAIAQTTNAGATITIDANEKVADINPLFYGLMTEEINYSYDGGLYAELIRNRTFRDNATKLDHWSLVQEGNANAQIALDSIEQKNTALTKNLRLDITSADAKNKAGIANDGFWGIPVRANTKYTASFYAKTDAGFKGALTLAIESNDGKTVYANAVVANVAGDWKKYTAVLTTGKVDTTTDAHFTITTQNKGTVWFSLVSLFPPTYHNRPNGNRKDLMELLADMKPSFLRFPGGDYLQSKTVENRFDWKKTIGDISQRPTHDGRWYYHSSDGMGLMEFLSWCEDLKIEPLLAVFDGLCIASKNPITGDSLKPFVEDALNELEFVNGDVTTKWGALRAKYGHPKPYNVKYVEIGNEDFYDKKNTGDERFTPFYDAIKAKYPDLQVISSSHVKSRTPDMEDIHNYFSFKKALTLAHKYDKYKRTDAKVFEGEWACKEGSPTTNFLGALGDAAFLTGLERNADIVKMSCYAPLFANVNPGAQQWKNNLIGYNAVGSYGSPSYYMQKTFTENIGDELVKSSITNVPMAADTTEQLFYSVTKDSKSGTLFLKVVNVSESIQTATIDINTNETIVSEGKEIVLTADKLSDTNSLKAPKKIVPISGVAKDLGKHFSYSFKPHSITVLRIEEK